MKMDMAHATVSHESKQSKPVQSKAVIAERINIAMNQKHYRTALAAANQALTLYPDDPYFLSFCGVLTALTEKKRAREGCTFCEEAIGIVGKMSAADKEFFYPVLHLNLGRAYLVRRKRKEALEAFHRGLKYDRKHLELLTEIRNLGVRKPLVVSFLSRQNPVNRVLGRFRHKIQTKKDMPSNRYSDCLS